MTRQQQSAAVPVRRSFKLTAVLCATGLALATFDQSSFTTALAAIRSDLAIDLSTLQWITSVLPLAAAVALPISGTLGDFWGARATMQAGFLVFSCGALLTLFSTDATTLLIARVIQGIGVALMLPNGAALLGHNLGDGTHRATAFGFWLMISSSGLVLGPLAGGAFAQTVGWRYTYAVMVPAGLLSAVGLRRLVDTPRQRSRSIDVAGLLTASTGLGLLCWALIEVGRIGRADAQLTAAAMATAGALVAFALFVAVEKRVRHPVLDLALLRNRQYTAVLGAALLYNLATSGGIFLLSIYLQEQRGVGSVVTGVLLIISNLGMPLAGRLAGPLARWRPPLVVMSGSAAGMALTYIALGALAVAPIAALALPLVLVGLTCGVLYSFDTQAVLERVPAERSASALATLALMRQVGGVLGIAVLGSIAQLASHVPGVAGERVALVTTGVLLIPAALWLRWARRPAGNEPAATSKGPVPAQTGASRGGEEGDPPLTAHSPSDTV